MDRIRRSVVFHNYSHMTIAQIAATVISLCIYPYVIRRVGAESYGLYAFALSVANYFVAFVAFGLSFPAVRAIAEQGGDTAAANRTVSVVYAIKFLLAFVSAAVFGILIVAVPLFRQNVPLMLWSFLMVVSEVVHPNWFFQGKQQMQYITYTAVGCRLLSMPLIYIFVRSEADIVLYAAISSAFTLLAAIGATVVMVVRYRVRIVRIGVGDLKAMIADALPFFSSSAIGVVKTETVTLLIGSLLGMRDVAVYDLANKIVAIPRLFIQNINLALFPNVVANKARNIRRIIRCEYLIGIAAVILVSMAAYPAVLILGGKDMMAAVPVVAVVSVSIFTWLVVGAYIAFVFVPADRYYYVTRNQAIALLSFLLLGIPAGFAFGNVMAISAALSASGLAELAYCIYTTRKHRLL